MYYLCQTLILIMEGKWTRIQFLCPQTYLMIRFEQKHDGLLAPSEFK